MGEEEEERRRKGEKRRSRDLELGGVARGRKG